MLLEDESGSNSIKPTQFDIKKLESLNIGDFFDGEKGNFRILKYKDSFVCLLFNHYTKKEYSEFANQESLLDFLNN